MLVVKEKPIVAREENPLLLGKPLVTKETPCCQGIPLLLRKPLVARDDYMWLPQDNSQNDRIPRYHCKELNRLTE